MSAIKEIIKSYIEVDEQVKELNKQVLPLRNSRTILGNQIQEYLLSNSDNPKAILEIGNDVFKLVDTKIKIINKEKFEEVITANTDKNSAKLILSELTEEKQELKLKRVTKK